MQLKGGGAGYYFEPGLTGAVRVQLAAVGLSMSLMRSRRAFSMLFTRSTRGRRAFASVVAASSDTSRTRRVIYIFTSDHDYIYNMLLEEAPAQEQVLVRLLANQLARVTVRSSSVREVVHQLAAHAGVFFFLWNPDF